VPSTPFAPVIEKLRAVFRRHFGSESSLIVRAPGRVNLIGEHTDYNDGFVMPLALQQAAWIAARPRTDRQVVLWSENFAAVQEFSLDYIAHAPGAGTWGNYTRGTAAVLEKQGYRLCGMDAVIWGDVPIGAGLSSSAALEVASALALAAVSGIQLAPLETARLTQRAEIEFVGVNCGIMDQMISVLGQEGHALLIDCRTLACKPVPIPNECVIVIADTMKRRDLVDSKYNERRAECDAGARLLGVARLRDVSLEKFERNAALLPEPIRRRCRHVVHENARVLSCVESLQAGDAQAAGRLMLQSHESLRYDYEVSCPELDLMVELALQQERVFGARMTGGGFGGCTVNLVARAQAGHFASELIYKYGEAAGIVPAVYICEPGRGAEIVEQNLHKHVVTQS
jgi:galactokinase